MDDAGIDAGMASVWRAALWPQFGAALEMFENAVAACPAALWTERILPASPMATGEPPADDPLAEQYGTFWFVAYHALIWTDGYLSGSLEGLTPPAPWSAAEIDSTSPPPERPYTQAETREYVAYLRQKARGILSALTDERARQPFAFPWKPGKPISYLELQLYTLRHLQEHAAQLSLFLGQRAAPNDLDWVMWAGGVPGRS